MSSSSPSKPQSNTHLMLVGTLQATVLSALSNVLAQLIDPWTRSAPFTFNFIEFVRFVLVQALLQPPLFCWQMWMETRWPGEYVMAAEGGLGGMQRERRGAYERVLQEDEEDDGDLDLEMGELGPEAKAKGSMPSPDGAVQEDETEEKVEEEEGKKGMRWKNVWTKWALDNTLGGFWYTAGFIMLLELFKFTPGGMVAVWHALCRDFIPLLVPSYIVWPAATLVSFIWVPVEKRIVFSAFVGLLWGIYLSLFASESSDVGSAASCC